MTISGSSICSETDAPFAITYREIAVFLSRERTELREKRWEEITKKKMSL